MRLDHLAIAAETLEDGVAWAEGRFGTPFLQGGKHQRYGTHNQLLGLEDGLYLEVIAVDHDGHSDAPRWFGLDRFTGPPRLANWICAVPDLSASLMHGMQHVPMQRGDLMWDMGVPPDGTLPLDGAYPTLLQWHTDNPPGQQMPSSGWALSSLLVAHPDAAAMADQLKGALDDPRVGFEVAPGITLSATFTHRNGETVSL